jgi:hypothetical protein
MVSLIRFVAGDNCEAHLGRPTRAGHHDDGWYLNVNDDYLPEAIEGNPLALVRSEQNVWDW